MVKTPQKRNAGMALITALILISIAAAMLGTLLTRNINQSRMAERFQEYNKTMYGAESAVAMSIAELEGGEDGIVGLDGFEASYNGNNFIWPEVGTDAIQFKTSRVDPGLQWASYTVAWENDNRDSNGDGTVDSVLEEDHFTVYAMSTYQGITRKVEAVYAGGGISVWDNAIFAGSGQAGGLINGNVSIHGSVHLLGNALPEGETAIAAIELSGTSLIHNNYDGLTASLRTRVPALSQITFEGESVDTIDAVLRIKNGLAGLSGNSEIGQPQETGNSFKETMDGTFVTDGWTGNAVVSDGDRGDPTSVWSDNGWDETYDLGDVIPFPLLSDEWRHPDTGERVEDPDTGTWYTHETYFNEVLVADPDVENDGIYVGNIDLAANGNDFYWNATTGEEITGAGVAAAAPAPDDDYIKFTHSGNDGILQINGQVRINGDLTFSGQGNKRTIHYSGRAALLAYGDITINANLITCNGGNKNDTANSFPVNNIIGLMAAEDMYVGTTSQLQIMGAFYAQNKIVSAKQTTVMGTFVSNYFDMGTNVPDIYQVPELSDNLPFGMIGDYPIFIMQMISWREV